MMQQIVQCSRTAPPCRVLGAYAWRWLAVLLLALGAMGQARAACPASVSFSVASGGAYTVTCENYAAPTYGFGWYQVQTQPSHGVVTFNNSVGSLIYTNDGGGATSDSFSVLDADTNALHTFTVTIQAPTSSITITPGPTSLYFTGGTPVNVTFAASGGTAPYTFSETGTLPSGVTYANGALSGTPTAYHESYSFSITATDSTHASSTWTYTGSTSPGTIVLSPSTVPAAYIGHAYTVNLSSIGGLAPYTYSFVDTSVDVPPPGISISPNGVISGTPTTAGTYTVRVQSKDSETDGSGSVTHNAGFQYYTITVGQAPTITVSPSALTAAKVGVAYGQAFSASGGTSSYTYAVTSGSLPAGMNLSSGGTLSGTPTAGGTFNFTVTATDANKVSGSQAETLTVNPPTIAVSTAALSPSATVGQLYTPAAVTASGGTSPYTYAIGSGALPAGMNLSGNGTLSGTPTASGTFNFTVTATDNSTGTGAYTGTSSTFTLTVSAPTITVGPGTISNPQVGVSYSQQFTASGGTQGSGYTFAATGTVPAGLSLSSSGLLSGTPTSATSSASFTITATDQSTGTGAPFSGSQGYTVSVAAPTLSMSPASGATLSAATQGSSYNQQFTASGGTVPYTYQVTGGTLPAGLSVNAGGLLSGAPTEAGTFNFTVTATDGSTGTGSPFSVSGSYTLNVQAITPVANPVSDTVSYGSASNVVPTSFSGGTPTSVAIVSAASHGTATASGTTITYTPTSGYTGTDSFTYTGTNAAGTSAPATVSITVSGPTLAITSSSGGTSLTATVGQSFTQTFTFSGGKAPYSGYSITGIPAGLSVTGLNNTSITISGTPTVSGTFQLGVSGTDSSTGTDPSSGKNAPFSVSQSFTLHINTAAMSVSPASGALNNAIAGTAYSQQITAAGGISPYAYTVTSGALPSGVILTTAGMLKGTPTKAGTFQFQVKATDSSTGAGSPATASASYTLTVSAPTLTVTPASLPGATGGVAYSQTLSTSGGTASYTYAVTSGALPAGLSLSSSGTLSGTPTVAGNFSFTVTTTDSLGFTGTKAYALAVSAPTLTVTPASLPGATAGSTFSQALATSGGTAPYTYVVTTGTLPAGLSLSGGGVLSGTPSTVGNVAFTVTATDSLGFTGVKAYVLTVNAAPPVAVDDTATTLAGHAVTVAVTANDTGSISSVAIAQAPGHGTASVSGTSVVYTPAAGFEGTDTFTYTDTGPGGTSAPATVTVTVHPVPQAVSMTVSVVAGATVHVDLTAKASGGPFTAATLVSMTPAGAGSAQIVKDGSGYRLDFTALTTYAGSVAIDYTLSNAYATSAPATVTVDVTARPDPTRDAEVMGLLNAQVQSVRRFMRGQIDNVQGRLESLNQGAGEGGFQNDLSFTFSGGRRATMPGPSSLASLDPRAPDPLGGPSRTLPASALFATGNDASTRTDGRAHGLTFWASGVFNFGTQKLGASRNGIDFSTSGVTVGADTRLSEQLAIGAGVGYGHDASDVGREGSRSTASAHNVMAYASYRPGLSTFIDGQLGYQWLSFRSDRYVTADGNLVHGRRSGDQIFGSVSGGYQQQRGTMMFSPYGRLDMARARLDGYTEYGDALYALHYDPQTIRTTSGALGLRMAWSLPRDFGVLRPSVRVEFRHDFQGSSDVTMTYADMTGPLYRTRIGNPSQNHTMLGLGVQTHSDSGLTLRLEYQNLFDSSSSSNQSILLRIQRPFD